VRDFFPVQESAKIFSLLMLILGLSPLLAPTAGGFIATGLGWHWVFIVLILIVVIILTIVAIFLPEGHQPDHTISLKPRPILTSFFSVLKERQFLVYSISGALSFSTLLVYVAGSPVIFMGVFHVSPQVYGGIFALLAVGFIGSNQVNVFLLRKYRSDQLFRVGLTGQVIVNTIFFIGAFNNWWGLEATIVLLFITLSGTGFTYPNASALALAPFSKNVGSASALLGFLQIGIGGLISTSVGLFNAKDTAPLIGIMLGSSFLALMVLLAGKVKAKL
jgi:DHA1 family bicyclomycin/chloramphenicol resistance-like MFS transporter